MGNLSIDIISVITIAAVVSAGFYFVKAGEKKDLTYLAVGLSRLYYAIVLVLIVYFPQSGLGMQDALIAILVIILTDIISSIIYIIGKKYLKEIQYKVYSEKLKDLQDKYSLIVENSPIGFFTLDMAGNFEFANQKLLEILETDELVKKNIFEFLDKEVTSGILVRDKFSFPDTVMISKTGRRIHVQLIGGFTRNGHQTITGSIHPL